MPFVEIGGVVYHVVVVAQMPAYQDVADLVHSLALLGTVIRWDKKLLAHPV
jgi:hypothetical protein